MKSKIGLILAILANLIIISVLAIQPKNVTYTSTLGIICLVLSIISLIIWFTTRKDFKGKENP